MRLLRPTLKRSGKWPELRQKWLKEHPTCDNCGSLENPEVHHKVPVHIDPTRELDETNLKTLCENPRLSCHLVVGHLLSWFSFNETVDGDAAAFLEKVKTRP